MVYQLAYNEIMACLDFEFVLSIIMAMTVATVGSDYLIFESGTKVAERGHTRANGFFGIPFSASH